MLSPACGVKIIVKTHVMSLRKKKYNIFFVWFQMQNFESV